MTFRISKIRSLSGKVESSFSTSAISSFSDATRIPAEEMTFAPDQEFIARAAQNDALVQQSGVIGGKGGTVGFKTPLVGLSTYAEDATQAIPFPWIAMLLKSSGLAESLGTGSTTTATTHTTTSVTVSSASGISVGSLVAVGLASGNEVRLVTAKSTNTLTLTPALSAAPDSAGGTPVYACAGYYLSDSDPGTMTFVAKGDGFEYTMTGCKAAPPKFTATARGRPMLEWSFQVDSWTVTTTSGTLPSLPAIFDLIAQNAPFYWGTGATSTPVGEFSFDPGATLTVKPSTEGANGRAGYVITDSKPSIACKPYYASAFRSDYSSMTERVALYHVGKTQGAIFAVVAEKAQIAKYPGEADVSGNVGHDLAIQINAPSLCPTSWAFGIL